MRPANSGVGEVFFANSSSVFRLSLSSERAYLFLVARRADRDESFEPPNNNALRYLNGMEGRECGCRSLHFHALDTYIGDGTEVEAFERQLDKPTNLYSRFNCPYRVIHLFC